MYNHQLLTGEQKAHYSEFCEFVLKKTSKYYLNSAVARP